jgi:hypothetical protein
VSLVRQQGVADTRSADWIIILNPFLSGPGIQPFVQFGAFDVLGRLKMVRRYDDFFRVEDLVDVMLLEH